jgi:hypothetical protein
MSVDLIVNQYQFEPKADRESNRMRTIMAEVLGITGLQTGPA